MSAQSLPLHSCGAPDDDVAADNLNLCAGKQGVSIFQ